MKRSMEWIPQTVFLACVSTQSSELLNLFAPENILVAERQEGSTTIKRLDEIAMKSWLKEYTLAELWKSNVLGGRPTQ